MPWPVSPPVCEPDVVPVPDPADPEPPPDWAIAIPTDRARRTTNNVLRMCFLFFVPWNCARGLRTVIGSQPHEGLEMSVLLVGMAPKSHSEAMHCRWSREDEGRMSPALPKASLMPVSCAVQIRSSRSLASDLAATILVRGRNHGTHVGQTSNQVPFQLRTAAHAALCIRRSRK